MPPKNELKRAALIIDRRATRALIVGRGLTISGIAHDLRRDRSDVSAVINGRSIDLKLASQIAKHLDLTVEDLFEIRVVEGSGLPEAAA
jgi:hypothetical protein